MASSMAQIFLNFSKKTQTKCSVFYTSVRHSSIPPKRKQKRGTIKHRNLIQSSCESLEARGFLRCYKPYDPPTDVSKRIAAICQKVLGTNYSTDTPLSRENKFDILNNCFQELSHSVPNSLLHTMNSVNDIVEFYQTPVITKNPFELLKEKQLPPNLHIQYDYVRFTAETSGKFKGTTAFPESSTIVSGLRYRDKYKGYKTDSPSYYDDRVHFDKSQFN